MFHSLLYRNLSKMTSLLLLAMLSLSMVVPDPPVSGKVVDDYGYPVQGVVVHIKGVKTGSLTDKDGAFVIDAAPGTVLVFEHSAYNVSEATIKSGSPVLVRLADRYLHQPFSPGTGAVPSSDTIYVPYNSSPTLNVLYGRTSAKSFLGSVATAGPNQLSTIPRQHAIVRHK